MSEEEMAQICSACVTLNTEKNTKWSAKVFSEWRSARIKKGCDKDSATALEIARLTCWKIQLFLILISGYHGLLLRYSHRSLPALRRVSSQQQEAVTRIMMITDEKNTTFAEELELLSAEEDGSPKQEPHKSTAVFDSIFSSCTVSNVNIGKTEPPN